MKKINPILTILLTVLLLGCVNDDCGLCFTPPEPFLFEIVDKTSGENLFTNGTYNSQEIEIINTSDNSIVEFTFIDENDINLIQITSIGWQTEMVNMDVNISSNNIFHLFVDAERVAGECCDYTRYNEIRIENTENEYDSVSGIYKILVE